jgi:hypothetical protein
MGRNIIAILDSVEDDEWIKIVRDIRDPMEICEVLFDYEGTLNIFCDGYYRDLTNAISFAIANIVLGDGKHGDV